MVVIDNCFQLNVVCFALDFLVNHGDIDDNLQREMMAQAVVLSRRYRKEIECMRERRKALV